jgi:alpha-1,2-mannosyltransferase
MTEEGAWVAWARARADGLAWALAVVVCVALGAVAVYRLARGQAEVEAGGSASSTDFDGFWRAGRDVREGRDIYVMPGTEAVGRATSPVRRYLPFFAVFMVPLSLLPLAVAGGVWHVVSFASLIGSIRIALRLAGRPPDLASPGFALVAAATAPFWVAHFASCQVALPVLWLALAGVEELVRGRDGRAGALWALAAALKVTPGLLVVYALLKRRFAAAAAFTGAFALTCALTVPVFGPARAVDYHLRWLREARTAGAAFFDRGESLRFNNASLQATLARLLQDVNAGRARRPFRVNVAALGDATVARVAVAVQVVALVAMIVLCAGGPVRPADVGLVLGITGLFSPIAWTFHFVALIPAVAVLAAARDRTSRVLLVLGVALELTLASEVARAVGGLQLANLVLTAGCGRLSWLARREAPAEASAGTSGAPASSPAVE